MASLVLASVSTSSLEVALVDVSIRSLASSFYCPICQVTFAYPARAVAVSNACQHIMCIPCAKSYLRNYPFHHQKDDMPRQLVRAGKCCICNFHGSCTHSIAGQFLPHGIPTYGYHIRDPCDNSQPHQRVNAIVDEELWNSLCVSSSTVFHLPCEQEMTKDISEPSPLLLKYIKFTEEQVYWCDFLASGPDHHDLPEL